MAATENLGRYYSCNNEAEYADRKHGVVSNYDKMIGEDWENLI